MGDTYEGGCACGQVRYVTTGPPARTGVCHCRYCQLRTGSAFGVSVYFASPDVTVTGETRPYAFTTESGRAFTTHFCPTCGTSVFWRVAVFPDLIGVAGGTFDPPTFWFVPVTEVFTRSRAPFVHLDVPQSHATSPAHAPVCDDPVARRGG